MSRLRIQVVPALSEGSEALPELRKPEVDGLAMIRCAICFRPARMRVLGAWVHVDEHGNALPEETVWPRDHEVKPERVSEHDGLSVRYARTDTSTSGPLKYDDLARARRELDAELMWGDGLMWVPSEWDRLWVKRP